MLCCTKCSKVLGNDDVGFYKKMVNRGAQEYMCIECTADYFGLDIEKAHRMIERFRESGCTLFVK